MKEKYFRNAVPLPLGGFLIGGVLDRNTDRHIYRSIQRKTRLSSDHETSPKSLVDGVS